jgi:hypothetical protein
MRYISGLASFVAIRIGAASRNQARHDRRPSQQSTASSRPGDMSDQIFGGYSQVLGMPGERPHRLRVCRAVWFHRLLSPSESPQLREVRRPLMPLQIVIAPNAPPLRPPHFAHADQLRLANKYHPRLPDAVDRAPRHSAQRWVISWRLNTQPCGQFRPKVNAHYKSDDPCQHV